MFLQPILDRLGNWSWCSPDEGGLGEKKYRYTLTSLSQPQRCIGFARRRVGRGGRLVLFYKKIILFVLDIRA